MYTFRKEPRGIVVISESGYEIPWGKNGTIPAETYRLRELNDDLNDEFSYWFCDMTCKERVALKEDFLAEETKTVPAPTLNKICVASQEACYTMNLFGTFSAQTPCMMGIKKEKETMNTIRFEDTQEGRAQTHVLRRADTAYREKGTELEKHYGLRGDDPPPSWEELLKRIKDGKFVIEEKHAKMHTYDPMCYVQWRDPKIVEDKAGLDKSMEKLTKLLAETKDAIIVKSAADGLEMIEKIQNFKH